MGNFDFTDVALEAIRFLKFTAEENGIYLILTFSKTLSRWQFEKTEESTCLPVVDQSAIKKLEGFLSGNQDLVGVLIEEYTKSASVVVDKIFIAMQNRDLKSTSALAHGLKSASSTLGLLRVAELCQAIESLKVIPPNFVSLISKLEAEVFLAQTGLSRLKSNFS